MEGLSGNGNAIFFTESNVHRRMQAVRGKISKSATPPAISEK